MSRDYKREYAERKAKRVTGRPSRRGGNLRAADAAPSPRASAPADPVPSESEMPTPIAVKVDVQEDRSAPAIAAPLHAAANEIPAAGEEGGSAVPSATAPGGAVVDEAAITLDPKTVTTILCGAFDMVALVTREDHWKVEESEVEGAAEPLCRQLMRIPIIAAIGQNVADIIIIGMILSTVIAMRLSQSVQLRRDRQAAKVLPYRPAPGATTEHRVGGSAEKPVVQEVRQSEWDPNLEPFKAETWEVAR